MNILNQIATHKVVEINDSVALRSGHMISQAMYKGEADEKFVDNGRFFCLSKKDKDMLVKPKSGDALKANYFLHYTEELMTATPLLNGYKYFTVDMEDIDSDRIGHCYPRCLALYVNDTFTTDNYTGTESGAKFATVDGEGQLKLETAYPSTTYEGPVFAVKATTLPDGSKAMEFTVLDTHAVVGE